MKVINWNNSTLHCNNIILYREFYMNNPVNDPPSNLKTTVIVRPKMNVR